MLSYPTPNSNAPAVADDRPQASTAFRLRRPLILLLLICLTLSLVPFYPEDMDYFAGGVNGPTYPMNLLGSVGAHLGWFFLMTLGIAAYPLLFIAILCCLRRLLWRKRLLPSDWEYFLSVALFGVGLSLLFAIWPNAFPRLTSSLNIQGVPGGVVGQIFCDPSRGLIHKLLSTVGCVLVSGVITVISASVIWHYDWQGLWGTWLQGRFAARKGKPEEIPEGNPAPEQPAPQNQNFQPPPANLPEAPQFQEPISQPLPDEITSQCQDFQPQGAYGFRTRRGQASLDAARQAAEAIDGMSTPAPRQNFTPVPQRPPMTQPELPPQPIPAPEPIPQPQQFAPIPQAVPTPQFAPAPEMQGAFADPYALPLPLSFYQPPQSETQAMASAREIEESRGVLQRTLDEFNIDAEVVNAISGPQVTLYEIQMGSGVPLSKLGGLQENLSMALKARRRIRMLLPIPGKDRAGIEVPNRVRKTVCAHELFSSETWSKTRMHIPLMLGKNINGDVCMLDLQKAPHLLVAGATGSGKSVCMNLMIQSMLLRFPPDKLKLVLFDPKFLEFAPYGKLPHLVSPIINEAEQVAIVLNWACREMDKRYKQLAATGVKQLDEFNARPRSAAPVLDSDGDEVPDSLPYLVIIIDELADIIARAKKEVDVALGRLAGKARAAGIHMIVATQRPSSDVITGVIKSNFPQRIALQVTDQINSRVILDNKGAENLLGQGDMLYSTGAAESERIQCGWVTNEEIAAVANACATQDEQHFDESLMRALESRNAEGDGEDGGSDMGGGDMDMPDADDNSTEGLVRRALGVLERFKRPTISVMQRQLRIGYNKSADLMQELEDRGYVGPQPISGMREIYWDNFPGHGGTPEADDPEEDFDSSPDQQPPEC